MNLPATLHRRQHGAALLLLLAVMGVGAATLLVSALSRGTQDTARVTRTLTSMGQANDALVGFAIAHRRLPRPAISPLDGRERPLPCASATECTGLLPWVTLGLPAGDAWGSLLRYSVTPSLAAGRIDPTRVLPDKRVWSRTMAGQLFLLHGERACSGSACAAAVLIASGKNGPAMGSMGIAQPGSQTGNVDEQQNYRANNDFIQRTLSEDPATPGGAFDDLVTWLPAQRLYLQMSRAGAL